MANFRKSFNLRNGVQVDDDNFIVNANGLVGIGTSVPIETLDVRGTTRIVGLLTASLLNAPNIQITGFGTFGTITDGTVRISGGIVTATTGVVTYYGDGKGLVNIPTSQWVDVDPGAGTTSIYAAGRVGIATTNPVQPYFLQVGGNPDSTVGPSTGGVGINSRGNIKASGIITASTYFSGLHFGEVNSTGISTFTVITIGTGTTITSGVITSTQFVGSFVGIATSALSLTGNPSIGVGTVTAIQVRAGLSTVGIITVLNELDVGIGATVFTALVNGFIGIGTANPTSQLQIRRSSTALFEIISNTSVATISVGQSVGVGKSTGTIRFGDDDKTFDIVNNDTGNLNFYLHSGSPGINTGRFEWYYGQTNTQLMSLTYEGRLGLGKTNPDRTLHVVGTSTVTGAAFFGGNVDIYGTLTAATLTLPSVISGSNIEATTGISTFNDLDVLGNILVSFGSSIGIGTTTPTVDLDAKGKTSLFGSIGIATNVFYGTEVVALSGNAVIPTGGVGIGTTYLNPILGAVQIYSRRLDFYNGEIFLDSDSVLGFNTNSAKAIIDFSSVGSATTRPVMVIPNISTATRTGIAQTPAGSMIFNTTTSKFQGYTGVAWTDFH